MNHALDMLRAFEIYYSTDRELKYNVAMGAEIADRYSWITPEYRTVLYEMVVSLHPASLRSLPDVAVLKEAEAKLDRPEVYRPALPEPEAEFDYEDLLKDKDYSIEEAMWRHRDEVAAKRSNMTVRDKWWLLGRAVWGDWRKMPEGWDMDWREVVKKYEEARR